MSHSGNRPQPGNDDSKPGEESGLLSERSLTIAARSIAIAVLSAGRTLLTAPALAGPWQATMRRRARVARAPRAVYDHLVLSVKLACHVAVHTPANI